LISEIILENFMSYQYARIPLDLGLNIVCGPNGAGKSSILLAISVALGQAYTERGRKFSDLIRWGEDTARVTLTFDNKPKGEARPIPKFDTDYFRLSRYLKKDGNYWFQANFKTITKGEVVNLLSGLGINPDNMLIIMHQHMMMEFGVTMPQQKLLMVEEAVGFRRYRENLFEAQRKLNQVLSEEESVSNLLKNAEQTLAYWKGEYDRYLRRRELLKKKDFLEQELAWARLIKKERNTEAWKEEVKRKSNELIEKKEEMDKAEATVKELSEKLEKLRFEQNQLYHSLLELEKKKIGAEEAFNTLSKTMENVKDCEKTLLSHFKSKEVQIKAEGAKNLRGGKSSDSSISEKSDSELIGSPEKIKFLEKRFSELQAKVQLLKQEAGKLEEENDLLEKLMKAKEIKETTLQRDRRKLNRLSVLIDEISPKLDALNNSRKEIALEETRINSFVRELNRIIERLPPAINIRRIDNPVELAKEASHRLRSEIEARKGIGERIKEADATVQDLTGEQQAAISEIRVHENEMEKLTKQQREISLFLEGKGEKPQIKCDKCGSILTPNQWTNRLRDLGKQVKATEKKLSAVQSKLEEVRGRLSDKHDEQDRLRLEERVLETIYPASTQVKQLLEDITRSSKALEEHLDKQKLVTDGLAELFEGDKPQIRLEQKVREIQTEARALKLGTLRFEKELSNFEDLHVKKQRERVEKALKSSENYRKMLPKMVEEFKRYIAEVESQIQFADQKKLELEEKVSAAQARLEKTEGRVKSISERYQKEREREVLLAFQKKNSEREIDELKRELNEAQKELSQLQTLAEGKGGRVETERSSLEILEEIRVTDAHLVLLRGIPEDVENIYEHYLSLRNELKEKATIVSENREMALKEVEERKEVWRKLVQSLLDEVNPTFQAFLEKIGATGWVRLVNTHDIEEAGLELVVGFKGAKPQILDSRTQSGGERSSSTMAFLLALQRHMKSPFRAVDEFDVHMDPRNREIISHMLLREVEKEEENQYLAITPGQLPNVGEDVQVITVQNVQGRSEIKVMAQTAQAN
jgi:chromosome segregation ATPase